MSRRAGSGGQPSTPSTGQLTATITVVPLSATCTENGSTATRCSSESLQPADRRSVRCLKLANFVLDETRRRVQNNTFGHRSRKTDPLYRIRKLMTIAPQRLDAEADAKLRGLLEAGDPNGEVRMALHAKEVVRSIYEISDPDLAVEFVTQLGIDFQDDSCPPEVQWFGRTITRWRHQISAWHQARFTNGPTEAVNNLVKRVKRVAFGLTNGTNYRTRALLRRPTRLDPAHELKLRSEEPQ